MCFQQASFEFIILQLFRRFTCVNLHLTAKRTPEKSYCQINYFQILNWKNTGEYWFVVLGKVF